MRGAETFELKSRKGQALLWYLAAHPDTLFPREHLHGLLWDDVPSDVARRDFNTMLSRLRAELPVDCFRGSRGRLAWNPDASITTDVSELLSLTQFLDATEQNSAVHGSATIDDARRSALRRAVSVWRGPFLDGVTCDSAAYENWMTAERHRWEMRVLAVFQALVAAEAQECQWEQV